MKLPNTGQWEMANEEGSKLKERKKKEIKQLLGLEPVSLVIKTDYDGLDMLDRQMTLTG